jgi:hypothetical protein
MWWLVLALAGAVGWFLGKNASGASVSANVSVRRARTGRRGGPQVVVLPSVLANFGSLYGDAQGQVFLQLASAPSTAWPALQKPLDFAAGANVVVTAFLRGPDARQPAMVYKGTVADPDRGLIHIYGNDGNQVPLPGPGTTYTSPFSPTLDVEAVLVTHVPFK